MTFPFLLSSDLFIYFWWVLYLLHLFPYSPHANFSGTPTFLKFIVSYSLISLIYIGIYIYSTYTYTCKFINTVCKVLGLADILIIVCVSIKHMCRHTSWHGHEGGCQTKPLLSQFSPSTVIWVPEVIVRLARLHSFSLSGDILLALSYFLSDCI